MNSQPTDQARKCPRLDNNPHRVHAAPNAQAPQIGSPAAERAASQEGPAPRDAMQCSPSPERRRRSPERFRVQGRRPSPERAAQGGGQAPTGAPGVPLEVDLLERRLRRLHTRDAASAQAGEPRPSAPPSLPRRACLSLPARPQQPLAAEPRPRASTVQDGGPPPPWPTAHPEAAPVSALGLYASTLEFPPQDVRSHAMPSLWTLFEAPPRGRTRERRPSPGEL